MQGTKSARLEGFKSLHLKVDNENFKAIGLYEKYGFVKVEQKMIASSTLSFKFAENCISIWYLERIGHTLIDDEFYSNICRKCF